MQLDELRHFCDDYLSIDDFEDYCPNGLQVEGKPFVNKLVSGVTANLDLIDAAIEQNADAILVHHGYFWKGEAQPLVGFKGRRVRRLMQNDISLNTVDFAMSGKHLHGSIYGYCNPRADIPKLLRLYDQGKLKLDELVTQKYALEDINEGYRALHDGEIIRGLIDFSL